MTIAIPVSRERISPVLDAAAGLRVDLLRCAALSESLRRALEHRGVRVRPHFCGAVEAVLQAFCHGRLDREEFRMPGCRGTHAEDKCIPGGHSSRSAKSRRGETRLGLDRTT
jgi:hypothetical protein